MVIDGLSYIFKKPVDLFVILRIAIRSLHHWILRQRLQLYLDTIEPAGENLAQSQKRE